MSGSSRHSWIFSSYSSWRVDTRSGPLCSWGPEANWERTRRSSMNFQVAKRALSRTQTDRSRLCLSAAYGCLPAPIQGQRLHKYIYPLKLNEYLAGGKPIVGTPIRSLLDFAHVIKLASTQEEWSRALAESLAPDAVSIDQIEKRRSIAKQVDWRALVHTIAGSFCDRLRIPYRNQFVGLDPETL